MSHTLDDAAAETAFAADGPRRVALVTDAWHPQVNGVVRTLSRVVDEWRSAGIEVETITPDTFRTVPCPTYPEIRLAIWPFGQVRRRLETFRPDAVHIATEGPLGFAAMRWCKKNAFPYTTSYHTKFPEYVRARTRAPLSWGYAVQRIFHGGATRTLVVTPTIRRELEANGFRNLVPWSRGVDETLFKVRDRAELDLPELPDRDSLPRPVFMNVGRVAVEKNIAAFLALDLPGTKVVVGDGPQMAELRRRFPETRFVGMQHGARLAQYYAFADVFVMPSLTETFGMVQLESLACGTPVAAFPVPGPKDLFADQDPAAPVGVLDDDLRGAALAAAEIPRARCAAFSARFTWRACAETAYRALAPGRRSA